MNNRKNRTEKRHMHFYSKNIMRVAISFNLKKKRLHFFQDTVRSAGDPNLARLSLKMGATWAMGA